jgi:outer membrane immunogenic protein
MSYRRARPGGPMRKSFLLLTVLTVLTVLASAGRTFAADMAVKAPPPSVAPATPYQWAGFYVGGNIGALWAHDQGSTNFFDAFGFDAAPPVPNNTPQSNSVSASSVIGGIQAGYNWQAKPWVYGVEADWDWTDTKKGFCRQLDLDGLACSDNGFGFLSFSEKTEWLGSARARLGYTWDRFMVYGTGGVAWGKFDSSINVSCLSGGCGSSTILLNTTGNFSDTRVGWVAGGGIEAMLTANWILRAEYLHYGFGNVTDTLNLPAFIAIVPASYTQSATWSHNFGYDTIRAGLSYKFN